jgi:hypothetical protein
LCILAKTKAVEYASLSALHAAVPGGILQRFNKPTNRTGIAGDRILATRNSDSNARTTQLGLRLAW